MTYQVVYTEAFYSDVQAHVDYLLSEHVSVDVIENWYTRLFKSLDGLDTMPKRMPIDEQQTN